MTTLTSRQVNSLVHADGTVELSIVDTPVPDPGPNDIVVRIEAAPINPSDLGMLFVGADLATVAASPSGVKAKVPAAAMTSLAARVGDPLPVGNEGGGVVVDAGANAKHLIGRTVGVFGGAMYAEYRTLSMKQCLVAPEGSTPRDAAAVYVNPMTALSMVDNMRLEGHTALVHTAAASNLGQMLVKICLADGVPLVNIVRRPEQVALLHELGAVYVCDTSSPTFLDDLTDALAATGATIAFDATGGGRLASDILTAMERAINRTATTFNRYGSSVHKQVYLYGGLDRTPTTLNRAFGFAWGIGGWLLTPYMARIGADGVERLSTRVAAELTTTFASHYSHEISLAGMLDVANIANYGRMATGTKYLVTPHAPG
jgi:NADPH:quinone reductase